jgi:hypothetical protein
MAAGAILPPLFFERRRLGSCLAPGMAFQEHPETQSRRSPNSLTEFSAGINQPGHPRGSLLKDI